MPLHSLINHELRRVTFIWIAPVTADSIQAAMENQAAEGAWSYGVLHDTRAVLPQPERAADIARLVKALSEQFGPRGPVALVVTADTISSAQKYALSRTVRARRCRCSGIATKPLPGWRSALPRL